MGLFSSKPPDGPRTTGRIVTIPASGRAFVVSDLHGHVGDWNALVARTRFPERLLAGEDVYLLVTGDVPDLERHRAIDATVPEDGDVQILDQIIALAKKAGPRADRIVYLEGNHDFHVLRIAREIQAFETRRGKPPGRGRWEPIDPAARRDYFEHYKVTYGLDVFANNVQPYDFVQRVQPRHLEFLARQPILAILEGAGTLVTHAGPPKMQPFSPRSLRKALEKAAREELSAATAEAYYASAYHQVLNNRFRANDYDLGDLDGFLRAFSASLLVTGHTPHPYLVDYAKKGPLDGCGFRDGLGFIGRRQVVLCTSFGAFDASKKRYLELDLSRRYDGVDSVRSGVDAHPLLPDAPQGAAGIGDTGEILRNLVQHHALAERRTSKFDPDAITEAD